VRLTSAVFMIKRGLIASLFFISFSLMLSCAQDGDESLFNKAEELVGEGKYMDAVSKYKDVALHHEKSVFAPDALFEMGKIYYMQLNDYESAIDEFNELVDKYPDSDKCKLARKYMADIYMYKLNDYKKAIVEYQKAIPYYQGSSEAEKLLHEISSAYFNLGNFDQQRVELKLLLDAFPQTKMRGDISLQIANSYYVGGSLDDAIKSYRDIIKNFPGTPLSFEAKFQLGVCLQENGDLKGAVKLLKEIRNVYPNPTIVKKRIERIEKRLKRRRR